MADEVSAALLSKMRTVFTQKRETDARIRAIRGKLDAKTATQADVADYTDRLGELLRDTLRETLTPEALPNETLYYNILQDTVGVMLKNAHRRVNEAAIEAQKAVDEAQGLHLNAEAAPYPQKRAEDLFYKVGAPGTPYETAMKRLAEPVATLTRAFHDDHIRHNADVRFRAGMGPKIVRTAHFNCCEWCSSLAGTYDYEDVRDPGNDVFRRHERCKCTVSYVCDGKKQDVWSKKHYEADDATLERREAYRAAGDDTEETLQARREYGLEQHRKTPEEMQAEYKRLKEERALSGEGENVLAEYIINATPGKGSLLFEKGYSIEQHSKEIETAEVLKQLFGGNIILLTESNDCSTKRADYSWNEKLWELKNTSTEKAANSAIRKAIKQIEQKPGGIILNFEENHVDMEELKQIIDLRMQWVNNVGFIDVMIIQNKLAKAVFRYKR